MGDILEPELIWVDGRCYRFCDAVVWSQGKELKAYVEEKYEPDYGCYDEESCDNPIEILQVRDDRFKHSFYVNSNFYRFIIGAKGATLKRLEADTKTIITVPRQGQNGDIVITGTSRRDIITAKHRIELLIETSRSKLEFTHFLSIPANFEELKDNFNKFKEDVLKNCGKGVRGIKENIFQNPDQLHLTIVMLVLLDEEDRKRAKEALETCKTNIILPALQEHGPLSIEFRGVEIMNDDPSEAKILYVKALEESGCLQKILDGIANYFIDQGLTRREYDRVKLHLTVMNTAFLMKDEVQKYSYKRETFDASYILQAYKNAFFGKSNFSSIHLSLRHSEGKDGYYQATSKITFEFC